jgi:hypothetical protein
MTTTVVDEHRRRRRHRRINTKMLVETGDIEKSQGWTAIVLDTNGNGKRDSTPSRASRPTRTRTEHRTDVLCRDAEPGRRLGLGTLRGGRAPSCASIGHQSAGLVRDLQRADAGAGVRSGDIDKQGRVWVSLASGHVGSFDRRRCEALNGPTATGNHCPEGWSFYQYPGPGFKNIGENSAERATTRGSTSTTRSALAMTSRCRPPT